MSFKRYKLPEPFAHIEVDVSPISFIGKPPHGLTVGVMNAYGKGTRTSLERAEAEAKTVLKAIRAYRRAHPEPDDVGGE